MHVYDSSGSITSTREAATSSLYSFTADAVLTFSSDLQNLISGTTSELYTFDEIANWRFATTLGTEGWHSWNQYYDLEIWTGIHSGSLELGSDSTMRYLTFSGISFTTTFENSPVPEPGTFLLFGFGLLGLFKLGRKNSY